MIIEEYQMNKIIWPEALLKVLGVIRNPSSIFCVLEGVNSEVR